jgi:hypothetical protein
MQQCPLELNTLLLVGPSLVAGTCSWLSPGSLPQPQMVIVRDDNFHNVLPVPGPHILEVSNQILKQANV